MASYSSNQFKSGLKVLIDNDPNVIVEVEFVKPGKGQAFTRAKMRNLLSGRVVERTYKSSESLEGADVLESDMQYLYNDGTLWNFMNPETFEQVSADANAVGDSVNWIKEEDICAVTLFNGVPIQVHAPNHVELKITQADPGLRGDTATGGNKPATVETGAVIRVPLFVEEGEVIRIDTRTGEYVSRVKA